MKRKVLGSGLYGIIILLLCYWFRLSLLFTAVAVLFGAFAIPFFLFFGEMRKRREADFYEMTSYMDQLICSYKRTGHIRLALQDCMTIFPDTTRIWLKIRQAVTVLETGEGVSGGDLLSSAFSEISALYNSRRMSLLHRFLCQVEKMGGDVAEALDILMTDLQLWKRRVVIYQEQKKAVGKTCMVSVVLAIVLCLFSHVLIPSDISGKIQKMTIYQLSTVVVLVVFVIYLLFVWRYLSGSWLDRVSGRDTGVEKEFSHWILAVTVYLQQDQVYQALHRSLPEASGELKKKVRELLEAIYNNPNSLEPYLRFCQEKNLPDVQTGMKLLYAVNGNGYQHTKRQVALLVEQNQLLTDQCEKNDFENRLALFGVCKQVPMVVAGAKIVTDVLTFFYIMLQHMSIPA